MTTKSPRKKPNYPGSLTNLHRYRPTVHGHDGSSRIVMVRKTDQRTFASIQNGKEPKLETITRETVETFRGQRTACKITTERKGCEENVPAELIESLTDRSRKSTPIRIRNVKLKSVTMDFQNECLNAHNVYRRKHGVPPLKLNKEMCKVSQDFANYLIKRNNLEHSNNQNYGENIYCIRSTNPNITIKGEDVVESWYEEIKKHDFDQEPQLLASGHFTQVIWKESKELGCAFAKAGGKIVVVANYYPPGNVIGTFVQNVPPLGGIDESVSCAANKLSDLNISKKKTSNIDLNIFHTECLDAHNKYRAQHGAQPLKLDLTLCKFSEEWAKVCADRNKMEHRKNNPHGENIFYAYSSDPHFSITGSDPVTSWYSEIKDHQFGKEPTSLKSGHFTQVVWKTSEKLGIGLAKKNGAIYVVCNYSPAGNFVGHFSKNVLPLGSPVEVNVPQTTQSETKSESDFELEGLRAHNEYRRKHNAPEMKLNKELCKLAKDWAEHCAGNGQMSHRPKNDYGENVYMSYSSDYSHTASAKDAVTAWYDEIRQFQFGVEKVINGTLHFTQVVWKNSTELGMGIAKNNKGETYIVANYNPRGNYIGQFVPNVSEPRT